MEETVRRVTPRTLLRSVLRQQAAFEGGRSFEFFKAEIEISEFFQFLERRKLGIFPSLRNMKKINKNVGIIGFSITKFTYSKLNTFFWKKYKYYFE